MAQCHSNISINTNNFNPNLQDHSDDNVAHESLAVSSSTSLFSALVKLTNDPNPNRDFRVDSRNETTVMHQTLDRTAVLKRLVLRHDFSMPEAELLAALLACAEPLVIKFDDCSKFNRFAASPLLAPAMAQFASKLHLSHLRELTLHKLPAAATSSHWCDLLFDLADRLSTHLLELETCRNSLYFA